MEKSENLEEFALKQIETILDSLSNTTNWIIGSLMVIAFSLSGIEEDTIEMFGFKVSVEVAGLAMFTFVFGLNFYILKLSRSLKHSYSYLSADKKTAAQNSMRAHFWICNPFAFSSSKPTFIDSIGYLIFVLLWWIGFSLGFKLSSPFTFSTLSIITGIIAILFLVVGLATGLTYGKLPWERNEISFASQVTKNKLRDYLGWCALGIGLTIFFAMNWTELQKLLK